MAPIYITNKDMERLRLLIEDAAEEGQCSDDDLQRLKDELDGAEICNEGQMPEGVITMNSKVRLKDLNTNEDLIYTLVYPAQANIELARISVLAPIGMAMIGYRVGDVIEWPVPGGIRRLQVKDVLNGPATLGDFSNKLYY